MATTPGSRRRETTRTDMTGDDRDTLTPMQEPLSSMDNPGSRSSNFNEVNLPPGETVRRTGNLGTTNGPWAATSRSGRGFGSTFALVAAVLLIAFLLAMYLGSDRSNIATGTGDTQAPIADSNTGTDSDTTGSTTPPSQQPAPAPAEDAGSGAASGTGNSGATTPPANP